ncbi:MAG: DNA-binding transcriptional regulator, CsgD family [Bradyrhizobium sp.]|jgi:DNA-binding CsgD family transcriptional regulator|nr:DNA-binding transcriptional regulator, CsgD family [Bradyrhizobium sp.]MEA2869359.1 hypothetical protein [Bradyrhizobium sp.]
MSLEESSQLLDLIYEAAAVPDKWPAVLDSLAKMAGAAGTFLITADPRTFRMVSSECLRHVGEEFLEGRWHERNTRLERLMLHKHAGFIRDVDLWTPEDLECDPNIRDLLRPLGLGWAVGTLVQVPSDDMLVFSIERRFVDGPVEAEVIPKLNALRPHLARASLMSARLGLERALGMAESLTMMGLPAAVLLRDGKVAAANSLFEHAGSQIVASAFGKVALTNARANALLSETIENLNSGEFQFGAKSIAVPADEKNEAMVVHVIPVRRSAHDIFGPAMGILMITPLASSRALPDDLLNGLFDLSPAEIRTANGLLQGKTIDDLAAGLGLSRETIRSQVKAVFAKTGTARQSDLISLLANVRIPQQH